MPSRSPAQHRLMEAAAHTKGGFGGVPQKVGKEFAKADKGKYATGGPALRPTVTDELRKAQFDADIAQAKSGDTRENSRAALDRLAARGVDLPGLVRGRMPLEAGNKENYKEGGLYANIHAKQERIEHGSKEKMRRPGAKGAPTAEAFKQSAETVKKKEGGPSLAIGRGEKLSVAKGAGLTAKGRAKYNRETGSHLKAPQPGGGGRKDSFCARMSGVVEHSKGDAPRAKASLKRWKCPGW